jgi:Holliday junction resolvasome RuvABC endonuclease subunit
MRILGIDQSLTNTALVIYDSVIDSIVYLEVKKTTNKFSLEERIKFITESILETIEKHPVDRICIENLSLANKFSKSSRELGGLFYNIVISLHNKGYKEIFTLRPKTLKSFVYSGDMEKEDMFQAIHPHHREKIESLGYKKTTGLYDLSDAFWLAKFGSQSEEKLQNYKLFPNI